MIRRIAPVQCFRQLIKIAFLISIGAQLFHTERADAQSPEEYGQRRMKLMSGLPTESVIVTGAAPEVVRNDDVYYDYRQSSNFYYLTGFEEPGAVLVMSPGRKLYDRETRAYLSEMLFIPDVNPIDVIWNGPKTTMEDAIGRLGIECIKPIGAYESIISDILAGAPEVYLDAGGLSLESSTPSYLNYLRKAQEKLIPFSLKSVRDGLGALREVKTNAEIQNIQKAVDITGEALLAVLQSLKPEMYEYEIQALIEFTFRKNGSRRLGFPSIVGSGPNTCYLHYVDNNRRIKAGDLLLLDIGAEWNMYTADVTRTFPASGSFTPRQKVFYELVLKAQQEAIRIIKPGISHKDVHARAAEILSNGMKDLGLIQDEKDFRKYYMHGTSHFLGLDVHDIKISDTLVPGMVFTVEPGIYIPEEEIGIRIEDDIVVTETGCTVLSGKIPSTVSAIEALMRQR